MIFDWQIFAAAAFGLGAIMALCASIFLSIETERIKTAIAMGVLFVLLAAGFGATCPKPKPTCPCPEVTR